MTIIMGKATYPTHKQAEFVKIFIKIQGKYDMSQLEKNSMGGVKATENGFQIINLWDIKEGKTDEAMETIGKMYYEFINIEGCEFTLDVFYSGDEALKIAGVNLPE